MCIRDIDTIVPPSAEWITIPAPSSPSKAMNNPIPTEIALFIFTGIESTMASLTLNAVNNKKIIPSNNTAVKANWYEYPIDKTTVYAKNAFNPIPGANRCVEETVLPLIYLHIN